MAIKTLKNDSRVTISASNKTGTIARIKNGVYFLKEFPRKPFTAKELKCIPAALESKKKKPIPKFTATRALLNAIYAIISKEFLLCPKNQKCAIKLPGCRVKATQVHHKFKRTGFYLIMSKYFLPCCDGACHTEITTHSAKAIADGISISRHASIPYSFTERELELMAKFGVSPP